MKKFLSLVLIVCMLFSSLALLSSCGSKVSVKSFEENPAEALSLVLQNTNFLADNNADVIGDIITESMKGGSVEVIFESNTLMGSDMTSVSEKIYMQADKKELVSDTVIKYRGEDLAARVFVDKSGFVLDSQTLLGSNKPIKIDMTTLAEGFTDSAIAGLMGMPESQADEVDEMLDVVKSVYEKMFTVFDDLKAQQNESINKIYNIFDSTATEAVVTVDGKEYDCVVITCTVNNKSIEAYLRMGGEMYADYINKMLDFEGAEKLNVGRLNIDSFIAEYNEELEYMIDEMNEEYVIDVKIEMNIDTDSAAVISQTVKGTVSEDDAESVMNLDGNLTYGESKISGGISAIYDERTSKETYGVDFSITDNSNGDNVNYKIDVNYKADSKWEKTEGKIVDLTYTYNKATTEFTLDGKLGFDGEESYVALKGTMDVSEKSFKLAITSATLDAITVNFKLTVIVNKEDSVPQRPADALDVVTMTEGNWVDLINQIQNSPIAKLLVGDFYY